MKYLYGLAVVVLIVVGVAFYYGRESNVEPAQGVLMTNELDIKGLTKIGDNCEQ